MENVGYLLDAKRECACSENGRVRGCMTFEWNGRWCCLLGAEMGCVGVCMVCEWNGRRCCLPR